MGKLTDALTKAGVKPPARTKRTSPLWAGPEVDGVTFSMLSRFLVCRERFRLMVVEGLRPTPTFNHRIEYGNMWHVCEEAMAEYADSRPDERIWGGCLQRYAQSLCRSHPLQQEQIDHWYNVCRVAFPIYVNYWSNHHEVQDRKPLLQEHVFAAPYRLPSGRTVKLRGKWDSVDLVGKGKQSQIWLQENKTKGQIEVDKLCRQLTFDLQTMLYLVALRAYAQQNPLRDQARALGAGDSVPLAGVRYNVIRRPLSGGKGSIVRHKPTKSNPQGESKESFYERVQQYIIDAPEEYFMRFNVAVTQPDVDKFRRECLDPVLEQLCDWWEWVSQPGDPFISDTLRTDPQNKHWRHPFGVYNVLDEGGSSDLDEYLSSGSMVGLSTVDNLFPELT